LSETLRRILHCDMDCFYAQVHMRDDPSLRGKPVIIGGSPQGRGVVAAASYEVRRFGVHSAMPAARAVKLCPHAIFLKPDFPRYRAESTEIFAIFRRFTPVVQPASLDEAYLDVTHHLEPWGSATAIAREVRRQVLEERRLTVSVGVGPNRLVAKIASDQDKPDGLTVVKPHRVLEFLSPLSVRRLHGVGPATEKALNALGITTVDELRRSGVEKLGRRFGRHGRVLWEMSQGIDERPVRTHRVRKSLGHERTYAHNLLHLEAMDAQLIDLAKKVSEGLRQRELMARTITVKARYPDFTTPTRSRTFDHPVVSAREIAAIARDLLRQTEAAQKTVRLLGVTASNLTRGEPEQLLLFEEEEL
jgi:DNA polymerase-4